jgi:hypothetical protein
MGGLLALVAAIVLLGIAGGMISLERAKNKIAPPFPRRDASRLLYWLAYLSCIVLGVSFALAAAIR